MSEHISVLLDETVEAFSDLELQRFVDGTLGMGGHSEAILQTHPECQELIGIDADADARAIASQRLGNRAQVVAGNFAQMGDILGQKQANGILLDLGVSSLQLDRGERGFSFRADAPLDMRMDQTQGPTAADLLNSADEEEIARILFEYGELKNSRRLAKVICDNRPIETTSQLVTLLSPLIYARGHHPLTLVFQALRIAVNDELGALQQVLPVAIDHLAPGGRLAIITFHSLEDRIVKVAFQKAATDSEPDPSNPYTGRREITPQVKLVAKKPITPTKEECRRNPRARSAKLRIVQKV